ncbi:MDR family MFS transporter [Pseudooceanicola sp.]|uniref:MDR family MFS transporter n=1 Tax=Pseudooceanicola sp. TaxID=1914328 RepID=UPI0026395749|nr:MDR family MFS transporter [Pseudooceanicola sp.]MDF1856234.1 MDR family MFS transporter [Pseudooceanicola sp.]
MAAAEADQTPPPEIDKRRLRIIFAAIASTLFLSSIGNTVVAAALPRIVSQLGGLDYITWVVTAFLLASTIGAPISGRLGDLYGRKVVLQAAIIVFLVGSVICGTAQNMLTLVAGRLVQGYGGGSLIVLSMASVADVLPPRQRGQAQGVLSSIFGVSSIIGPLVGGYIVSHMSWHWIFWLNLPIGMIAFTVISLAMDKAPSSGKHRIDYLGGFLLASLLSTLVLLANLGGAVLPWTSPTVLALLALAPVVLLLLVRVERRAAEPIMPPILFTIRNFQVANSMNFLVGMTMFGTIAFMPTYLQVVKGLEPAESGMFLVAMMFGMIGTSILAGRSMSRTGRYKWMPIASTAFLGVAMFCLSNIGPDTSIWLISANLCMVGIGLGPTMGISIAAIQSAIPIENIGIGTASVNMFRLTGGAIGTSLFGGLFAMGLGRHVRPLLPGGGDGPITFERVIALDPDLRAQVIAGFSEAITPIYGVAMILAFVACLISMRLEELPLGTTMPDRNTAPAE